MTRSDLPISFQEVRYFYAKDGKSSHLGRLSVPSKAGDDKEYLSSLVNKVSMFLEYSGIELEGTVHVDMFLYDEIIYIWISESVYVIPKSKIEYMGEKDDCYVFITTIEFISKPFREHALNLLIKYLSVCRDTNFNSDSFFKIHISLVDLSLPLNIVMRFLPKTEIISRCPNTHHLIEINDRNTRIFIFVNKDAWNNKSVTMEDLIFN